MVQRVRVRLVTGLLVLAMLAVAATPAVVAGAQTPVASPVTTITPTFTAMPCTRPLPEGLVDGQSATCGIVTAPLYYDRVSSETVELSVVRIASQSANPPADPIVFLTGGPGQPLAGVLPAFGTGAPYEQLRANNDVILFDQRGMGQSTPSLACPFEYNQRGGSPPPVATPSVASEPVLYVRDLVPDLIACGQTLRDAGIDQTAFGTLASAADINAIRIAFDEEKVDLWGISYGTELAQTVLRDFPDAVDTAVLGSIEPLGVTFLEGQFVQFDLALKRLFDACRQNPACAAANPDPAGALQQAVDRLNANPPTVEAFGSQVTLDGRALMSVLYNGLFAGPSLSDLVGVITATAAGDMTQLTEFLLFGRLDSSTFTLGATFTYLCQEEYPDTSEAKIAEILAAQDALPVLQDGNFELQAAIAFSVCAAWDLPAAPARADAPVQSDTPALLISGEFDPITPPAFGDQLAADLSNATHVVLPGFGHDALSFGGACTIGLGLAFLADPAAQLDTSCVAQLGASSATPGASPVASPVASPAA